MLAIVAELTGRNPNVFHRMQHIDADKSPPKHPPGKQIPSTLSPSPPENSGTAVLDREILDSLRSLWEGPFGPENLAGVELGVRAFLTARALLGAQRDIFSIGGLNDNDILSPYSYRSPFGDGFLDHEFLHPEVDQPIPRLESRQSRYLTESVCRRIGRLPRDFIAGWIFNSEGRKNRRARKAIADLSTEGLLESEFGELFRLQALTVADHFVRLHALGCTVYSTSQIGRICNDFIFTEWPNKLFEGFEAEYRATLREIRGPGLGIDLPPLTTLLLSRAESRMNIPAALVELRAEYAAPRTQLWAFLDEMWNAETVQQQQEILRKMKAAADSMFLATFPERRNVLSIALKLAQLSPSGVAEGADLLLNHNKPRALVSGVSLAAKLSNDMRQNLLNARKVLKRHFTASELREFGVV